MPPAGSRAPAAASVLPRAGPAAAAGPAASLRGSGRAARRRGRECRRRMPAAPRPKGKIGSQAPRGRMQRPTYDDVVRASSVRRRDGGAGDDDVRRTGLVHSPMFSRMTGSDVYLKAEYRQKTGSFKIRGAYYKVRSLSEEERRNGVVAASAGNHAQGVAYAASAEGIPCTIVMPQSASPAKVAATRGYGATVVLHGASYEESWARAREISGRTGATIIHAFDDPHVIAAQGVVGLEILEDLPDVDEVYVPIGGGGLAAGVLIAVKARRPDVRVVGVQSSSFPSMRRMLDGAGGPRAAAPAAAPAAGPPGGGGSPARTIADGISVKAPGELTSSIIRDMIDDIVLVDDSEIIEAMFLLMERMKAVVEPAGAVGLAHLLAARPSPGKKVAVVLAGGNVDMYLLGQIVDKGLARMGRLLKVFILLPDRPGALKEVVDEITSARANIVEVVHDRFSRDIDAGSAGVTLSLETDGRDNADALIRRLEERGIRFRVMT